MIQLRANGGNTHQPLHVSAHPSAEQARCVDMIARLQRHPTLPLARHIVDGARMPLQQSIEASAGQPAGWRRKTSHRGDVGLHRSLRRVARCSPDRQMAAMAWSWTWSLVQATHSQVLFLLCPPPNFVEALQRPPFMSVAGKAGCVVQSEARAERLQPQPTTKSVLLPGRLSEHKGDEWARAGGNQRQGKHGEATVTQGDRQWRCVTSFRMSHSSIQLRRATSRAAA